MNIVVVQLGARRHYQQPILLHKMGVLKTLYTDFYIANILGDRVSKAIQNQQQIPSIFKQAFDRFSADLIGSRIVHYPILAIQYKRALSHAKGKDKNKNFIKIGQKICQKVIDENLHNIDAVYGYNSASLELFQYAHEKGIRCILDQTLADRIFCQKLLLEEENKWNDWSLHPFHIGDTEKELADREHSEQLLADTIICGSDFVKQTLIQSNIDAKKIYPVPIGNNKKNTHCFLPREDRRAEKYPWKCRDTGLHILFAGSVCLRKGIPYLLEALHQIKGDFPFFCKIAGSIELQKNVLDEYSDVCQFLGRVPRSEMSALYAWSDIFVFPSLCEGSAMVTHEALQHQIPVITTANSGSIIRNGLDGWIVPERDSTSISRLLQAFFESGNPAVKNKHTKKYFVLNRERGIEVFKGAILSPS